MASDLISTTEAAQIMQVCAARARALAAQSKLPGAQHVGRNWVVPRSSAEAWRPCARGGNPNWRKVRE